MTLAGFANGSECYCRADEERIAETAQCSPVPADPALGARTSPMMWIVRLALRRPYTFVVFALLILIVGVFSIESMPTDIFPNIDIPIVTVVWQFTGLSAEQMANRIVSNSERGMTTTVNDIEHIESNSLNGIAVIKVFFQPHVNVANAVAQVTSISQVMLRQLAAGHYAALHHSIQRIERAGAATGPFRGRARRAETERPGTEHDPHASSPPLKARRRHIPTAASSARSRSTSISMLCRPKVSRPPTWSTPSTRRT